MLPPTDLAPDGRSKTNQRGFVLVVVIWLAGLIAAISTAFAIKVRLDTIAASAMKNSTELEMVADGMARLTAWRLATGVPMLANGVASTCQWNSRISVVTTVQDQSGLVSLNLLPAVVYKDLLAGIGASPQAAESLTSELIDFRDLDHLTASAEPEPTTYPNRNFGPKNAPLQIVEELDQLPGLRDDWYRKLKPLVTTYSGQAAIDPQTAPSALRMAFDEAESGAFKGKLAPFTGSTEGKTFDVSAVARVENGSEFQRRTMIVVLRQPDRPYATMTWTRGVERIAAGKDQQPIPPCIRR